MLQFQRSQTCFLSYYNFTKTLSCISCVSNAKDMSTLDYQMAALTGTWTSCTCVRRMETLAAAGICFLSSKQWPFFPSRVRPTRYHPELFVLHLFIPVFLKSNSISPNHFNLGLPLSPPPKFAYQQLKLLTLHGKLLQ